jgi:hypothetical protein
MGGELGECMLVTSVYSWREQVYSWLMLYKNVECFKAL